MTIGDNLKKIRKEKKLTQQQLAKKMGISRSYLSDIENNRKNPSSKTIEQLAEKLGVSMFYLTTGKKTLADLTDEERQESWEKTRNVFLEKNKEIQNDLKEELKQLIDTELSFIETTYINIMLRFLKIADTDDIIGLSSAVLSLIRSDEYKNADDADKDELNEFLKSELEDITKFFHDYFFEDDKEGD